MFTAQRMNYCIMFTYIYIHVVCAIFKYMYNLNFLETKTDWCNYPCPNFH